MDKSRKMLVGLIALVGMACFSLPAKAEIKAGQQIVSLNLGAGISLDKTDLTNYAGGSKETAVNPGIAVGGQYLYHLTPAFGFGGDFSYAAYGGKDHSMTGAVTTEEASTWALQAMARYVLLAEKKFNPYLFGGFGVGQTMVNTKTSIGGGTPKTNFSGSATGPAFSLGAGIDGDITESLLAGIEFRWTHINALKTFDDQVTAGAHDNITPSDGLTIGAKVGYKFGK